MASRDGGQYPLVRKRVINITGVVMINFKRKGGKYELIKNTLLYRAWLLVGRSYVMMMDDVVVSYIPPAVHTTISCTRSTNFACVCVLVLYFL